MKTSGMTIFVFIAHSFCRIWKLLLSYCYLLSSVLFLVRFALSLSFHNLEAMAWILEGRQEAPNTRGHNNWFFNSYLFKLKLFISEMTKYKLNIYFVISKLPEYYLSPKLPKP